MLTKERKKMKKPSWMGEITWAQLLDYWESKEFKEISSQNKTNRASVRGGALHSTGRKSHPEIALGLVSFL